MLVQGKRVLQGNLSVNPREVHCGIYFTSFFLLLTWKKVRLANAKPLLEKQKAAIGIKHNPASCHQVELPNHSLSPSSTSSTCRHQWGQCALMQLELHHPCISISKRRFPSSVLIPHLHKAIAVLNELR